MATKKTGKRPAKKASARTKAPARSASTPAAPDGETRRLEAIVDVFSRSDLAELDYEDRDIKLKLSRYSAVAASPAAPAAALTPATAAPVEMASAPVAPTAETHTLKSPFVGTFYRAPSPDAPVFTDVGERVSKGQTVCIIEAMKLMNEIPSDADGTIVSVLVENGEAVQFGDPLFEIAVK